MIMEALEMTPEEPIDIDQHLKLYRQVKEMVREIDYFDPDLQSTYRMLRNHLDKIIAKLENY